MVLTLMTRDIYPLSYCDMMKQTVKVSLPKSKIPGITFVLVNYVYSCIRFLSVKYSQYGISLQEFMKTSTGTETKRQIF